MSAHRPDYEQESHDELVEQYAYQLENQHDSDAAQDRLDELGLEAEIDVIWS